LATQHFIYSAITLSVRLKVTFSYITSHSRCTEQVLSGCNSPIWDNYTNQLVQSLVPYVALLGESITYDNKLSNGQHEGAEPGL